jgi:hypothetical protein
VKSPFVLLERERGMIGDWGREELIVLRKRRRRINAEECGC